MLSGVFPGPANTDKYSCCLQYVAVTVYLESNEVEKSVCYFAGMLMRPAKCEAEAKAEARYHKAVAEVEAKAKKKFARPTANSVRPRPSPEMPY